MSAPPDLLAWSGGGERPIAIDDWIGAEEAERAEADANAWIKALRHARVDGIPLRDRFTHRGDSLWWFAELYLHKRRVAARALRALAALETLAADGKPVRLAVDGRDAVVGHVAHAFAAARGIPCEGPRDARPQAGRLRAAAKAAFHTATSLADRLRPAPARPPRGGVAVAAFVHSAFWRLDTGEEAYIGPVIRALQHALPDDGLRLIGVGPRTNFRVRRWRDRAREFGDPAARALPLTPVEAFSSWKDLQPSLAVWRARTATRRALAASADLRDAARLRGCDLWPLVEAELAGIAELQFPWSARAMDEAGAALDWLGPRAVVTYAEAGGWGRALVLEARRRGIGSAGIQHGFIYRHWLNYLHEPDEMAPSPGNPSDAGFPRPDRTLLFDAFAEAHLAGTGRFPRESLAVTGSARLDAMAERVAAAGETGRAALRREMGVTRDGPFTRLVVVAAKRSQLAGAYGALVRAVAARPEVRLVVKPHPAEAPGVYRTEGAGPPQVEIAPAGADLARLLAAADLVVTANSTAAIEAMVFDVPALVVALPNNLSPFVEAGAMAGADAAGIPGALSGLLYDQGMRDRLRASRQAFMARHGIRADGQAARRAAGEILDLARAPRKKGL